MSTLLLFFSPSSIRYVIDFIMLNRSPWAEQLLYCTVTYTVIHDPCGDVS